jgi:hypothetical protein
VTRSRLLVAIALLGLTLAGQAGTALADPSATGGSPSPSASLGTDGSSSSPSPDAAPSGSPGASPSASPSPGGSPGPNQAPIAHDDNTSVGAGQSVTVDVLANDTDDGQGRPDGTPPHLEVTGVTGTGATFTAKDVTYRAADDESGTHTVTYTVSDGELTAEGQFTVDVLPAARRSVSIHLVSKVATLRSYQFHGVVLPTSQGRPKVTVQRRTGTTWVGLATVRADTGGGYTVPFRTNRPTRQVFRAVARWADGNVVRSDSLARQVHAVMDVRVSGPLSRARVPYSWRPGCPVPPSGLRKVSLNRFNYQGVVARGSLVVRATAVSSVVRVFTRSFKARFPLKSMNPTDKYYAGGSRTPTQSDLAAMRAGNTAAFNCRSVTGNPYRISQHSYGNAIDINTIQNPYVTGSHVYPSFARKYLNRSTYREGMILSGGVIATQMRRLGWQWGARWSHPDYQHFSSNGG